MSRPLTAWVDPTALVANLTRMRACAPHSKLLAVVKANAYGHGAVRVARALAGAVDGFAVASLDEALVLREAGVAGRVMLLEGLFDARELEAARAHRLDLAIHRAWQVEVLRRTAAEVKLDVWCKVDTGMHRLGFDVGEVRAMVGQLRACAGVGAVRVMTHLACADDRRDDTTSRQLDLFEECLAGFDGERSIANSAGVLGWPRAHADWLRPGIALYGASPFVGGNGVQEGLRPAMTLSSRLISVKHVARGEALGYGATWVCPEDMPVGVVAAGYGDGYPRHAPSGTPVRVNGATVALVGRVSMDMLCVDLRSQPKARVGDPVVLWGEGLPVETVAAHAGTIPYEVLCALAPRVEVREGAMPS